jgi:hypothetical protein
MSAKFDYLLIKPINQKNQKLNYEQTHYSLIIEIK